MNKGLHSELAKHFLCTFRPRWEGLLLHWGTKRRTTHQSLVLAVSLAGRDGRRLARGEEVMYQGQKTQNQHHGNWKLEAKVAEGSVQCHSDQGGIPKFGKEVLPRDKCTSPLPPSFCWGKVLINYHTSYNSIFLLPTYVVVSEYHICLRFLNFGDFWLLKCFCVAREFVWYKYLFFLAGWVESWRFEH